MHTVATTLGVLGPAGALELRAVEYAVCPARVALHLVIPGQACSSQRPEHELQVRLCFEQVMAMDVVGSHVADEGGVPAPASAFDEILESAWVVELRGKVEPGRHRHFVVRTNTDVFSIVCEDYSLAVDG